MTKMDWKKLLERHQPFYPQAIEQKFPRQVLVIGMCWDNLYWLRVAVPWILNATSLGGNRDWKRFLPQSELDSLSPRMCSAIFLNIWLTNIYLKSLIPTKIQEMVCSHHFAFWWPSIVKTSSGIMMMISVCSYTELVCYMLTFKMSQCPLNHLLWFYPQSSLMLMGYVKVSCACLFILLSFCLSFCPSTKSIHPSIYSSTHHPFSIGLRTTSLMSYDITITLS